MEKSISRVISEFAINLRYNDLPQPVIETTKRFLYDSIGCAFGAYNTKDVNIVHNVLVNMGGKEESTIIAFGEKIPAINATLINSLMIRSLDFNDIYWKEDPSHPSDLIPAALSAGEIINATMQNILTAIVIGYEIEQRLCEFAIPGIRERKWHHATLTQFVSPIVAGKVLGLSLEQMINAIGISASHNFTIGAPASGKLTMMKNFVDPIAVQSGVFAALLARQGFTGPELIFEGKEGLMDCLFGWDYLNQNVKPVMIPGREKYGEWKWDLNKLTNNLGENFKILECSMKAFPTEALTHTPISATLNAVIKNNIDYNEIESVTIKTIARVCDILFDKNKYRPTSRETADHSLPYCIAAAIVDRKITTSTFSEEKLKDERIWKIIDKIKGIPSEDFEKMFPEKQPAEVIIKTISGKEFHEYLEYPKGHPKQPMTISELELKFNSLTDGLLNSERQNEIKEMILNCDNMLVKDFMNKLVL
ncbi:MmgE/PrpD family protein [Rosettibacter firmus]|uniref:MmgE/PrpD family protein n=1 Tax=Rosettibacter firmus TaxID=3111522 RepID=UPI00336C2568